MTSSATPARGWIAAFTYPREVGIEGYVRPFFEQQLADATTGILGALELVAGLASQQSVKRPDALEHRTEPARRNSLELITQAGLTQEFGSYEPASPTNPRTPGANSGTGNRLWTALHRALVIFL